MDGLPHAALGVGAAGRTGDHDHPGVFGPRGEVDWTIPVFGSTTASTSEECVRPLVGGWSMVTARQTNGSPGTRPIGYEDCGGG
jgi:hypothetical protein